MQDYFYIKDGGDYFQITFAALLYAEAMKRYVRLVTLNAVYLIESSLSEVEHLLPDNQFCRIHKSYIASLCHMKRFNAKEVTIGERQLPIGRQYREILYTKVLVVSGHVQPVNSGLTIIR